VSVVHETAPTCHATDEIPPAQRISAWRKHLSDFLIELQFEPDPPESELSSVIVMRPLHDLRLLKMTFTAAQIVRERNDGNDAGYFLMVINVDGVVAVSSIGRQLTLNEGEAVLLDSARSFTIHRRQQGSCYFIRIPRGRMAQLLFPAETMVMKALPRKAGLLHVFVTYLNAVLQLADAATPRVDHLSYRHVTDLIALLLDLSETPTVREAGLAGDLPDEAQVPPAVRFQAARAYIVEHGHERISIRQAAAHLGITERHLQRLFENNGTTFTAFLNEIRLARAHALLCDRDNDRLKIRSICFKTGFRDVSYFNRMFRARYGCTPAEVRLRHIEQRLMPETGFGD